MITESSRAQSVNERIRQVAEREGQDPNRIRRQLAFHRLVNRLAASGWVLKGGYCLEIRLRNQARATQDMDVVRREAVLDADTLLDELDSVVQTEGADGFAFETVDARQLRTAEDPHPAWRVSIRATLDGREFVRLKLDVVTQFDEVAPAVEELEIPSPVPALGHAPVVMLAVDVYQHAAEKFHAMGRVYSGGRPSTRVKDLVDLALLADAGLLVDPTALGRRLVAVHQLRDRTAPPDHLPEPPADWARRYEAMAGDLDLTLTTSDSAFERVHEIYHAALAALNHERP